MSESRELSYHGHDENDEEADIIYTPWLHEEDDDTVYDSSDIKRALHKPQKIKRDIPIKPKVSLASADLSLSSTLEMLNTFDRPACTKVEDTYAGSGSYTISPEDKPGKRTAKTGVYAEAGVGRARAEFSVFEAEAKGPNVSAGAEASTVAVGAMAQAEIASASAKAGPLRMKVGLGFDTGASIGADGLEVKFLGTGLTAGTKNSVSLLGTEVSCSVM